MSTIILTGGGTAGHCIPHLALIPYLKNDFTNIYYIGSKNGLEKNIIENTGIPYYSVTCAKLKRSFSFDNLSIPFRVLTGVMEAGKIIDKLKPDVIFSKGGFVALPTVIAANKRKIPVISHESDFSVGLANKLSAKYCKKILTSFPETAREIKNGEYTGSPIRKTLFNANVKDALSFFGFSGNKPIVLITGGSLGAQKINATVREALNELLLNFDVIHICGKGNLDETINLKGYYQTEFLNKIENAFAVCSVCVSRAGSNTLFELLSLNIPTVLIPLPKGASRGDQIQNAEYFQKLGVASVLPQQALTKQSLIFNVNSAYANRSLIKRNLAMHPITDKSRIISRIIADYKR